MYDHVREREENQELGIESYGISRQEDNRKKL